MPEGSTNPPAGHAPATTGSDRSFGLIFAGASAVIALWPLVHGAPVRLWALALAAAFLIVALVRPRALHPLNQAWALLGRALQQVTSPIILGFLFFIVIAPVALLMRMRGKDPMRRGFDAHVASYWLRRERPTPTAATLRRQF